MLVRYSKPQHVFYKQSLSRLLTDVTHLKQDLQQIRIEFKKVSAFHTTKIEQQSFQHNPLKMKRAIRSRRSLIPVIGSIAKFYY